MLIHREFIACLSITWERREEKRKAARHLSACSFLDEAMALCGLVGRHCTCTIRSPRTPILSILWPVVGTSLAPSPHHTHTNHSPTPIKNKRTKNNAWELNSQHQRAKGTRMLFGKYRIGPWGFCKSSSRDGDAHHIWTKWMEWWTYGVFYLLLIKV
jgi:hypothetical protein